MAVHRRAETHPAHSDDAVVEPEAEGVRVLFAGGSAVPEPAAAAASGEEIIKAPPIEKSAKFARCLLDARRGKDSRHF